MDEKEYQEFLAFQEFRKIKGGKTDEQKPKGDEPKSENRTVEPEKVQVREQVKDDSQDRIKKLEDAFVNFNKSLDKLINKPVPQDSNSAGAKLISGKFGGR